MKRTSALAVLLLSLAPSAAVAFDWSARAGVQYVRDDTWTNDLKLTAPTMDVTVAASARGFVSTPELLRWSGTASYHRYDASQAVNGRTSDNVEYRLATSAFNGPRAPVTVALRASRQNVDLTTAEQPTSATRIQTYGGMARYYSPGRPTVLFGADHSESTRDTGVDPTSSVTADIFNASVHQGGTNFTYSGQYNGSLTRGTYATDNRDEHRGVMNVAARLSPGTRLTLYDYYFLRRPTELSPYNERAESNTLNGLLTFGADADPYRHTLSYRYFHGMKDVSIAGASERFDHLAEYTVSNSVRESGWLFSATAGTNYSETRLDTGTDRGASEVLSTRIGWRRALADRSLEVRVQPSVAARQAGGENDIGYGAAAGATVQRTWDRVTGQANYDASYATNVAAAGGSSFRHGFTGSLAGPLGMGTLNGQLSLNGERRSDPAFGVGAARSATADVRYLRRRTQLRLRLVAQEGLATPVSDLAGDGFFLAPSYDTRTVYLEAYAMTAFTSRLSGRTWGRIASVELPDRPTTRDMEVGGALLFSSGVFDFGLEERVAKSGGTLFNRVLVSVSRRFGAAF